MICVCTIGGNHSRIATQELLKEDIQKYSHLKIKPVDVYKNMPVAHAKRLARRHNRATSFTHQITTQDKVYMYMYICYIHVHTSCLAGYSRTMNFANCIVTHVFLCKLYLSQQYITRYMYVYNIICKTQTSYAIAQPL